MSFRDFKPIIWTARLLYNLEQDHVYGNPAIINRDYEGEIKSVGDTVNITTVGPITIVDYTANEDLPEPEIVPTGSVKLEITEGKAFNFQLDDIDATQSKPNLMDGAMKSASDGVTDVSDIFLAGHHIEMTNAATNIGQDTAPIQLAPGEAYDILVDMYGKMNTAGVPKAGRWVIVPDWFGGYLKKDARFTKDESVLRGGKIGNAAGFAVFESPNVPTVVPDPLQPNFQVDKIIAGHPIGWSYAEQIVELEPYRPEKRFADAMKGLHVYGAKVTRPQAFSVLSAKRPIGIMTGTVVELNATP